MIDILKDRQFKALIEKSQDVIVLIDSKAKVLYASPSIERLYGRKVKEITGISGLKYIHPLDLPDILKGLADMVLHPKNIVRLQLRVKHKDGTWRWVTAVATNLLKDPQINAIVVNFHDITEFKLLEDRKNEFISIASHELKTPVTVVKMCSQVLEKKLEGKIDNEGKKLFHEMDGQINKVTRLIDDLLNVSRIQEGKMKLQKEKLLIDDLVSDIVEQIIITNPGRKIIIRGSSSKKLYADKTLIGQVLTNLITNALKYSKNLKPVEVGISENENVVLINVKDKGKGIAKKYLNRIFEPFFSVQEGKTAVKGMGLGLYISSEIIKKHEGKIEVTSTPGKGSVFTVSLPVKK